MDSCARIRGAEICLGPSSRNVWAFKLGSIEEPRLLPLLKACL